MDAVTGNNVTEVCSNYCDVHGIDCSDGFCFHCFAVRAVNKALMHQIPLVQQYILTAK